MKARGIDRRLFKPWVWAKVKRIQREARAETKRDVPVNVLFLRLRLHSLKRGEG